MPLLKLDLVKTSVQVEKSVSASLLALYPNLTQSELIRLAMRYVLEMKPTLTIEHKAAGGEIEMETLV